MGTYLWDMDGTLYSNTNEHWETCDRTAILILQRNFSVPLPPDEIRALFKQSMKDGKHWAAPFTDRYGIPLIDIHHAYHDNLGIGNINPHQELPFLFEKMKDDKHCIVTHSSLPFAIKVLEKIGLRKHFNDARILGFEHYNQMKNHGTDGLRKALEILEEEPSKNVSFYEDDASNLSTAKRELGLTTIFIGARDSIKPEFVNDIDYVVPNICAFLKKSP